jgi:hypothetical protein
MIDTIQGWFSSPIFGLILCGYLPGIVLLLSAWRIARRGEVTASAPNKSWQSWRKPVTFKGRKNRGFVNTYIRLGIFILVLATIILVSMLVH